MILHSTVPKSSIGDFTWESTRPSMQSVFLFRPDSGPDQPGNSLLDKWSWFQCYWCRSGICCISDLASCNRLRNILCREEVSISQVWSVGTPLVRPDLAESKANLQLLWGRVPLAAAFGCRVLLPEAGGMHPKDPWFHIQRIMVMRSSRT